MEKSCKIASLGYITKEENLGTIEGKIFPYLVLEDKNPFPGYYDHKNTPGERKPTFLFFVINPANTSTPDELIRITSKIQKGFKRTFDAQPATINLYNRKHDCIRVDFDEFYIINDLLSAYVKEGIELLKARKVEEYKSFIKVYGFFELEEVESGVFKNITDPNKYYLEIPDMPPWLAFRKMVIATKNSSEFKTFDAALASIYQRGILLDFVRIYTEKAETEKLIALHKKFNYEMERNKE